MGDTETRVLEPGLDEETVSIDRMEIFRAGDYGERGVYGEADLDAMAATYDPAKHEAPATLDHAKEGPAYGWLTKAWREGQSLFAAVRNVPKTLAVAIQNGRYGKRSAEIYRDGSRFIQGAPSGKPYIRAVSFLGAQVPVVKGMAALPSLMSEATAFSEFDFPGGEGESATDRPNPVKASVATTDLPPVCAPAPEDSSADMGEMDYKGVSTMAEEMKCAMCKKTIDGKPVMMDGKPYCEECAKKMKEKEDMKKMSEEKDKTPEVDVKAFSEKIDALTATAKSQADEIKSLREANAKIKIEARDAKENARFSEVVKQARIEGRIPAARVQKLAALFAALPFDEDAKVIEFGEGEDKKSLTPRALLLEDIATSPRLEIYAETISTEESIAAGQKQADPDAQQFSEVEKMEKVLVEKEGYKAGTEETTRAAVRRVNAARGK